ncbi:hypothetical protein TWF225_009854 [Orbilia oligospora]|nr:hypothetical protein TWF225_009854 [Orbilia oligospora]KAF3266333.1 hypothetical protein TWF128_010749 [Orbilia oligospora]KAF3269300.1 hypothetical protein TWF217_009389 [Orbilia oligospora]KAF3291631.1 hypothetical protein TWF132_006619 [Orbilia oligospora]
MTPSPPRASTPPLTPPPYLSTFSDDTPQTTHLKAFYTILSYIDRILELPRYSQLTIIEFKEEIQTFLYWSFDGVKRSKAASGPMNDAIEMAGQVYQNVREGGGMGVPVQAYLRYRLKRFYEAEI